MGVLLCFLDWRTGARTEVLYWGVIFLSTILGIRGISKDVSPGNNVNPSVSKLKTLNTSITRRPRDIVRNIQFATCFICFKSVVGKIELLFHLQKKSEPFKKPEASALYITQFLHDQSMLLAKTLCCGQNFE